MTRIIKRIAAVLMAAAIIVTAAPWGGISSDIFDGFGIKAAAASGQCGDNATYEIDPDTSILTISGTGAIKDRAFSYYNNFKYVNIESGITSIGLNAFFCCDSVVKVIIPDTVTKIGNSAFYNCDNLKEISVPGSVNTIDVSAFQNCVSLETLTLNNGTEIISNRVFRGCSSLKSITIPESVLSIGQDVFMNCAELTSINVDINNQNYCSDVYGVLFTKDMETLLCCPGGLDREKYSVPDGVIELYTNSFYGCQKLKEVSVPSSVERLDTGNISSNVFIGCMSLKKFNVDSDNTHFCSDTNGVLYSKGKTELIAYPCANTAKVFIAPKSVSVIKEGSFQNPYLEEMIISGVEKMYYHSVQYCTALKKIFFGEKLSSISTGAFYGNSALTDVYYEGSEEEWKNVGIISNNTDILDAEIHFNYFCPNGIYGDITWEYNDENGSLILSGTGDMKNNPFTAEEYPWRDLRYNVTYIEICDGITSIGDNAFSEFQALKEVFLGKDVSLIGANAFADCSSLALVCASCNDMAPFEENTFSNNDSRLRFLIKKGSDARRAFYDAGFNCNSYNLEKEKDGGRVLTVGGKTYLYEDLDYNYIKKIISDNPDIYYLYFNKLTFDGVIPDDVMLLAEDNYLEDDMYYTLIKVYISARVGGKTVSLQDLSEIITEGNADAVISFDYIDGSESLLVEAVKELFEGFWEDILSAVSRVINTIIKVFKKK